MIRRHRRVAPASIVALLLLAAMVLIVIACVQTLLGHPPLLPFAALADRAGTLAWSSPAVLGGGGVLALLGLVLLVCAWSPGSATVLPLAGGYSSAGATRHSLRRVVTQAAGRVDGISKATATIGRRRVRTTVTTPLRDTTGLGEQVRAAVDDQLAGIALARPPRITVSPGHPHPEQLMSAPTAHTPNRPATLNRSLLTLAGLLLLLAGAYPLLRRLGVLATPVVGPAQNSDDTLLPAGVTVPGWVPWLVIAGAVIVGLGCLRWLLAQTGRRATSTTWHLSGDPGRGHTDLDADIAAAAIAEEITGYPGVTTATATITGQRAQPELHLRVTIEDHTPVSELRKRIDTHALPRLRHALERASLPTEILIRAGATPVSSARTQ